MNQKTKWALLAACALAGSAGAVSVGGTLYIKSKDTKVLDKADAKGKGLVTLQPGASVTWQGADKKNPQFHKIDANGKTGYVLQANLSPSKPAQEYLSKDGAGVDAQAFASSGAATKALSEAGAKYASQKSSNDTAADLIVAEAINKQHAGEGAVAAHVKSLSGGK